MKKLIYGLMIMFASCALSLAQSSLTVDDLTVNRNATFYGNLNLVTPSDSTNGLVLFYDFTTNTVPVPDLSGNGYSGSVSGATWIASGKANGGCYNLSGTNNWLQTPTNAVNLTQTNQLTILAWISMHATSGTRVIVSKGPSSTAATNQAGNYELRLINGVLVFACQTNATTGAIVTGVRQITDTNWHMVGVTVDAATKTVSLYMDGGLDKQQVMAGKPLSRANTEAVRIGRRKAGSFFDGWIDEVRIYGRVLTASEMNQVYSYYIKPQGDRAVLTADVINLNSNLTVNGVINGNGAGITGLPVSALPSQVVTNGAVATFTGISGDGSDLRILHPCSDIGMGEFTSIP